MSDDPAELVVPDGLRLDGSALRRMQGRLARSGPEIAGIVAAVDPLPAGSSFRVHAEVRSLLPSDAGTVVVGRGPAGAALLRPGTEASIEGRVVEVAAGRLLVDPGAVAHDPDQAPAPAAVGEPAEAPPFPWRPIVVFVADAAVTVERVREVRDLVNHLIDLDVEARSTLLPVSEGPNLTAPVAGDDRSLSALDPAVVVALDESALARVLGMDGFARETTVVAFEPDHAITLVPWTIGRASGRLRARAGLRAAPEAFADLVQRLVAGPAPVAPSVTWTTVAAPSGAPSTSSVLPGAQGSSGV